MPDLRPAPLRLGGWPAGRAATGPGAREAAASVGGAARAPPTDRAPGVARPFRLATVAVAVRLGSLERSELPPPRASGS